MRCRCLQSCRQCRSLERIDKCVAPVSPTSHLGGALSCRARRPQAGGKTHVHARGSRHETSWAVRSQRAPPSASGKWRALGEPAAISVDLKLVPTVAGEVIHLRALAGAAVTLQS